MQKIDKEFLSLITSKLSKNQLILLDVKSEAELESVIGKEISDARAELFVLLDGISDESLQEKIIANYKKVQAHRKALKEVVVTPKQEIIASNNVNIYCDGGASPNPGNAGSGVSLYRDGKVTALYYGLFEESGTNNTAELNALYQALILAQKELELNKNVEIKCDSMYSINCITTWAKSWEKNGWKKKGGEIKNLEIIKECYYLYNKLYSKGIKLSHVKAHNGLEGNELADRMTQYARVMQEKEFVLYEKKIDIDEILAM